MNLRYRSIGLLAGALLAIGGVAGVMADDTSVKTEAKLLENTAENNGDGICSASVTAHHFGHFRWDGEKYEEFDSNSFLGTFIIQTTQTISPKNVTCHYQFTGSNLESSGSSDIIDADLIALTSGVTNSAPILSAANKFSESVATGVGTAHPIDYNLQPAMEKQTPGDYEGTVTITLDPSSQP